MGARSHNGLAIKAICKQIAKSNLTKKASKLAANVKKVFDRWLLYVLQKLAVLLVKCNDLLVIGVVVAVAHYLAGQFNTVLQLDLPPETMQVLVDLVAVYLLKK